MIIIGLPGTADACFKAYRDTLCANCNDGYYELNGVCVPCNGGTAEVYIITLLVFAYFTFCGICLVFCSDKWLERATIGIVATQAILAAGDGMYLRFGSNMRNAYNYLRIFKL